MVWVEFLSDLNKIEDWRTTHPSVRREEKKWQNTNLSDFCDCFCTNLGFWFDFEAKRNDKGRRVNWFLQCRVELAKFQKSPSGEFSNFAYRRILRIRLLANSQNSLKETCCCKQSSRYNISNFTNSTRQQSSRSMDKFNMQLMKYNISNLSEMHLTTLLRTVQHKFYKSKQHFAKPNNIASYGYYKSKHKFYKSKQPLTTRIQQQYGFTHEDHEIRAGFFSADALPVV